MRPLLFLLLLLFALAITAIAPAAHATDGVLEINHEAVMASGGYPWEPMTGNYRLTGDLRPVGALGISLEGDDIVIDFNGFALIGDGSAFDGVDGSPNPDGHTLRNGAIRGFGGRAVASVAGCLIEKMQIKFNAGGGLEVGPNCIVQKNRIAFNGGFGGLSALGTGVVYSDNLFFSNTGAQVTGADSGGGNRCNGETCASPPMRRYYLTTLGYDGSEAADPGVCAPGFHFASLWEIADTSSLRYDTQLGYALSDAGEGPSIAFGWVRTGVNPNTSTEPGIGNCLTWNDANAGSSGTRVSISSDWDQSTSGPPPFLGGWDASSASCSLDTRVWCVQD